MHGHDIEKITERDFWSCWKGRDERLREAVRLGRAGKKAAAYRALAACQRDSTAGEWEQARRQAEQRSDAETSTRADEVRRGVIRGWPGRVIKFGRKIDFNANFGRSGQYGFHYLKWLVPLVDRFIVEGRPADLARVVDIVRQYYRQRTGIRRRIARLHPVYYELGAWAKTNVLLPAYLALVHCGKPRGSEVEAFLKLFLGFGRSLHHLQETGYRAGNWQIVGAAGLFRLGATFPRLSEAARWRRRGTQMMLAHLDRDFYPDGGHKERCWSYGWMSLRGVLDFYELGRRSGRLSAPAARKCLRSIRSAFRWFLRTMSPTGVCPAYGDGDLFTADEILAAAEKYLPAGEAAKRCASSVCLKSSGYAVMRDGQGPGSRYLNVNFGESGGGHTHDDLLDFNLWAFGRPLIEEVGRFGSYDNPLDPFFRSPEAHNQVVVDGARMDRAGARGRHLRWHSGRELDYFSASHEAFTEPGNKNPRPGVARVSRHVLFVRGAYWLVYDVVEPLLGETIFTVSSWLHSPRPFRVLGPGRARVTGRPGCLVAFAFPGELQRLETGVDVGPEEVSSPRLYPARYHLRARRWAAVGYRGPLRFAVLLLPYARRAPKAGIRPLNMKGSAPGALEAFEVSVPGRRDRITLNPGASPAMQGTVRWTRGRRRIVIP